jgi:hypothetical protein
MSLSGQSLRIDTAATRATLHSITSWARGRNDSGIVRQASSCFRVGLTRLVNEQDIRTPQHIKNRARNDPGILATDMKSVSRGLSSMRVMRLENGIRN